jgi:hypothetical protein
VRIDRIGRFSIYFPQKKIVQISITKRSMDTCLFFFFNPIQFNSLGRSFRLRDVNNCETVMVNLTAKSLDKVRHLKVTLRHELCRTKHFKVSVSHGRIEQYHGNHQLITVQPLLDSFCMQFGSTFSRSSHLGFSSLMSQMRHLFSLPARRRTRLAFNQKATKFMINWFAFELQQSSSELSNSLVRIRLSELVQASNFCVDYLKAPL